MNKGLCDALVLLDYMVQFSNGSWKLIRKSGFCILLINHWTLLNCRTFLRLNTGLLWYLDTSLSKMAHPYVSRQSQIIWSPGTLCQDFKCFPESIAPRNCPEIPCQLKKEKINILFLVLLNTSFSWPLQDLELFKKELKTLVRLYFGLTLKCLFLTSFSPN